MSFATKQRLSHKELAAKAQLATHALLGRCAANADWMERDLPAGQPSVRAKASLWTHNENTPVSWEATTPLSTYTVLLLLDDARLSLQSDSHSVAERACDAGSYYVSCPGDNVSVHCPGSCRALHLAVPVQLFWSGMDENLSCFSMGPARDALLLQLARTLLETHADVRETELTAQVMELLVDRLRHLRAQVEPCAAIRKKTVLSRWRLRNVDSYVKAHLSGPITLNDMAAAAGLSPMHFAAQFRAATGYRPHHYLLLCRMERAKQLMADVPRSMLDIALEVGFHTQSHFTTVFKRLTGTTPRQWCGQALRSRQM
jgi:AraC family transcriptional regulator